MEKCYFYFFSSSQVGQPACTWRPSLFCVPQKQTLTIEILLYKRWVVGAREGSQMFPKASGGKNNPEDFGISSRWPCQPARGEDRGLSAIGQTAAV